MEKLANMTKSEFEILMELSALEIPTDRREKLGEDISSILSYVNKLQGIDFGDVADPRDVSVATDLRADDIKEDNDKERGGILKNFPGVTSDDLLQAEAVLPRDL